MVADDSAVRLVIPARARFLRLARLTAAGIAGDLGFGLDAIEDLRVAVDEVCAVLIDGVDGDTELELVYRGTDDGLVIEGSCANDHGVTDLHPVARELLAMTADDYSVYSAGDVVSFRLLKRREVTTG
jgi:serine/threonine-protein kinase RsbW